MTRNAMALRWRSRAGVLVLAAFAAGATACASRGPVVVAPKKAGADARAASPRRETGAPAAARPETLESFMAKVRHLSTQARAETVPAVTLEGSDPELMAAIAATMVSPSPESYRILAAAYKRLKVEDKAYGALARALDLDSDDPRTWDALARLWRDAGLPHVALGDAHRAVHHSHGSAETRNTLGTVLQALGRGRDALAEFGRVVERDPGAAYGWNNLCYAWLMAGRPEDATRACRRSLELQPDFTAAQNNLGLARAQAGDMAGAQQAFQLAGPSARADFNLGVAQAATGQFALAAQSFERARSAQPQWRDAVLREGQAKRAAYQAERNGRRP